MSLPGFRKLLGVVFVQTKDGRYVQPTLFHNSHDPEISLPHSAPQYAVFVLVEVAYAVAFEVRLEVEAA